MTLPCDNDMLIDMNPIGGGHTRMRLKETILVHVDDWEFHTDENVIKKGKYFPNRRLSVIPFSRATKYFITYMLLSKGQNVHSEKQMISSSC